MNSLLECTGLTMRFGGLIALNGLDISVSTGETIGLVGPNGSGKTTFFNVITGLYTPSEGRAEFAGADIFARSPQEVSQAGIVRTFQRCRLMLDQSVFDNIALGAMGGADLSLVTALFRRGRQRAVLADLEDRIERLTRSFNPEIADRLFDTAGSFTMIDRRRIEICRALIANPRMLLLDEPSAGMTPDETRRLMEDVLACRATLPGLAVVLVEHEMDVIRRVSDRCVVLNFGKKIFEGGFDAMIADEDVQSAYLGGDE